MQKELYSAADHNFLSVLKSAKETCKDYVRETPGCSICSGAGFIYGFRDVRVMSMSTLCLVYRSWPTFSKGHISTHFRVWEPCHLCLSTELFCWEVQGAPGKWPWLCSRKILCKSPGSWDLPPHLNLLTPVLCVMTLSANVSSSLSSTMSNSIGNASLLWKAAKMEDICLRRWWSPKLFENASPGNNTLGYWT